MRALGCWLRQPTPSRPPCRPRACSHTQILEPQENRDARRNRTRIEPTTPRHGRPRRNRHRRAASRCLGDRAEHAKCRSARPRGVEDQGRRCLAWAKDNTKKDGHMKRRAPPESRSPGEWRRKPAYSAEPPRALHGSDTHRGQPVRTCRHRRTRPAPGARRRHGLALPASAASPGAGRADQEPHHPDQHRHHQRREQGHGR